MGGGFDRHNWDNGQYSHLAATGHYPPQHGPYPPQGYANRPPAGGYYQAGYPPSGGYPPVAYPGGYPPVAYPLSAPYHSGHGGPGTGFLAGGAPAAAGTYVSHGYGSHGYGSYGHQRGKFKHGKFGKHGGKYGKHKMWK